MNRFNVILLALILCLFGCLEDGRSEAEYLQQYSRYVDLGPPEPDASGDVAADANASTDFVTVTATKSECLEEPASEGFFTLTIRNTETLPMEVGEVYGIPGFCAQYPIGTIEANGSFEVQAYTDAVFSIRREGRNFRYLKCAESSGPQTVAIP